MGIFLVGVVLLLIGSLTTCIYFKTKSEGFFYGGTFLIAIALIVVGSCCILAISNQTTKEIAYNNTMHEKDILEYRVLERAYIDRNIDEKAELYSDIVEFKNRIYAEKIYANNFWTNWYDNDLIA